MHLGKMEQDAKDVAELYEELNVLLDNKMEEGIKSLHTLLQQECDNH